MMTETELQQALSSQYKLLCFEDLGLITQSHSAVFNLFKKLYKPSYDDDHRLVLYSSEQPSQKIINHIQRAAARHDISNWFILICCNHDLSWQLAKANSVYGFDDTVIQCQMVSIDATALLDDSRIADINHLCPMPFGHLDITQEHSVTPCCKFAHVVGNVNQHSMSEIFVNDQMAELRHIMIKGEKSPGCSECWQTEHKGTISMRQHYLAKYGSEMDHKWIDNPAVRIINLGVSSVCNFKCRICKPGNSTAHQVELIQHSTDAQETKKIKQLLDLTTKHTDTLVSQVKPMYSSLEGLHFLGGEPFIIPAVSDLIDDIVDSGYSQSVDILFNTNGSHWNDRIIKNLSKFKTCQINLSIDDIGSRFEIQRGGNWNDVKQNIEKFARLNQTNNVITKLGVTVNIQNVLYLDQLVAFANTLGLEIIWTYLESPQWANIDYMSDAAKKTIVDKYQRSDNAHLRSIADRIMNSPGSDGTDFINQMEKFDCWRNEKFSESHQEIFNVMSQSTSEVDQ